MAFQFSHRLGINVYTIQTLKPTYHRKMSATENLADAPKPWEFMKPRGCHVATKKLSEATCNDLWAFFHPLSGEREGEGGDNNKTGKPEADGFPWYQRFPRFKSTAHYSGWHNGKFPGNEGQAAFHLAYPALYNAATEALNLIKDQVGDAEPVLKTFLPESVAVMRHKPGWGLGTHYDNAHDTGTGAVLMISISDDDVVPRKFQFTDPPRGRYFDLYTPNGQVLFFTGEAYDEWMHESLREKKQTGECISLTIRLAGVCGHQAELGALTYATGAPAAKRVAHKRIRKKLATKATKPKKKKAPQLFESSSSEDNGDGDA